MRIHASYLSIGFAALMAISSLNAAARQVRAEEPLRWKFQVGDKLDYTMVQDMKMSAGGDQTANGNQNGVQMHQEIDMIWDVQGVDATTGEAVIKQKFDRLKTKLTSPQGEFEYDSKSEAAPSALAAMIAPLYKAMTQNEFEITMTSRGEIKDVKIPEEVLTALKSSPGAAAMGDIATAEGFKKMISKGALVLPENPPKHGETWMTKVEMDNPSGGKQLVETTYRYDGTKDVDGTTYAVIKPQLKMDFRADPEDAPGKPPQQLSMKIAEQTSDGEVLFNVEKGRLYSMTLQQKVTIEATAKGQTAQKTIDQKIDVKVAPSREKKADEAKKSEDEAKKPEASEEKKKK